MKKIKVIAPWAPDIEVLTDTLCNGQLPYDSTSIYNGPRNEVVKVWRDGRDINIKAFGIPNIVNRVVYGRWRKSKACRSYEHALRLRNLGFNTPEPMAYVELKNGLLFGRSYYVSQQLEDFRDMWNLDDLNADDMAALADALGAFMARLHDAGVWMKDFSRGNVLFRRLPKGQFEFFLIDINRMEFDVTDRAKLMLNFRTITYDDRFLGKLARAYARHAHLDPDATEREARAVHAEFDQKHRRKNKIKHILHRR